MPTERSRPFPGVSLPDPGTRIAPRWCWCTGQRRGAPRPQSASRQPQTVGRRSAGTKEGPAGARRPGGPQGPLQCGYPASPQREPLPARGRARAALAGREPGRACPSPRRPHPCGEAGGLGSPGCLGSWALSAASTQGLGVGGALESHLVPLANPGSSSRLSFTNY